MRGPPSQAFQHNRHISNGQAGWLLSHNVFSATDISVLPMVAVMPPYAAKE